VIAPAARAKIEAMTKRHVTTLRTYDGLHLAGTLVEPEAPAARAVVLVHGGGVTREEGGFFTRLADGLVEAGWLAALRPARARRERGPPGENTLSAILNDVGVALADVRSATGAAAVACSARAGGGVAAYCAAKRGEISRLVLLNPQLG
jgi:predicted alpha/beta-hydrolase family hydrolase